jgi:hypothetical protein
MTRKPMSYDAHYAVMLKLPILQKLAIFKILSEAEKPEGRLFVREYFPFTEPIELGNHRWYKNTLFVSPLPGQIMQFFALNDITGEMLIDQMVWYVCKRFLTRGFTDIVIRHGNNRVIPLLIDAKITLKDIEFALPPSMLKTSPEFEHTHVIFFVKQLRRKRSRNHELYVCDTNGSFISTNGGMTSLIDYFDKFSIRLSPDRSRWYDDLPLDLYSVVYLNDDGNNHSVFHHLQLGFIDDVVMNKEVGHLTYEAMFFLFNSEITL